MPPTNSDPTASFQAILNDVWDESNHLLRMGPAGLTGVVSKSITYAGGTTNDPGNFGGTGTPYTLFTVTGQVLVAVIAVCSVTLTGASGTMSVGVSGSVTRFIPTTTATTITAGRTVDLSGLVTAGTAPNTTPNQAATDGQLIIGTTGTANITAGVLTFYCFYRALTPASKVA